MQTEQQHKAGVFVELRAASSSDAYNRGGLVGTKWIRAARVWVRSYDDAGNKASEKFFGFIDTRCTGPRSRAGRVIEDAEAFADKLRAAAHQ